MIPTLTTKLRRKLLTQAFSNPKESYYVREFSGLISEDAGNLSRELRKLEAEGLFHSRCKGKEKHYSLNKQYPFYHELKNIITKVAQGLGVVLLVMHLAYAEECLVKPKYINRSEYDGMIFPLTYDISALISKTDVRFEPSTFEIDRAEMLASDFLRSYFSRHTKALANPTLRREIPIMQSKLAYYNRQYFGYKDAKGNKIVLINFLLADTDNQYPTWKDDLVLVKNAPFSNFILRVDLNNYLVFGFTAVEGNDAK